MDKKNYNYRPYAELTNELITASKELHQVKAEIVDNRKFDELLLLAESMLNLQLKICAIQDDLDRWADMLPMEMLGRDLFGTARINYNPK